MQVEPAKDLAEQIQFGLVNASFFPENSSNSPFDMISGVGAKFSDWAQALSHQP